MASPIVWFNRLCVAVTLAISLAPSHAFALPEACKADGGKTWYFSIGRAVYELKNFNASIVRSDADEASDIDPGEKLIPPNPAVPIGCRDNPEQLRYFRAEGWPPLQPMGYAGEMPDAPRMLWLIRYPLPGDDVPKGNRLLFFRELSVENCENKKYLTRYDDGTILCTDQTGDQNSKLLDSVDPTVSEWEFIISTKLYSTPFGDNLVVDNGPLGPSAIYLLSSDVILNYSWWIIGRKAPVDPAFAILVDQSIIAALKANEVNDYPWPKRTP